MKLFKQAISILILTIWPYISIGKTIDISIPADQIEIVQFENNLEERLSQDIKSYLNHSNFILTVKADIENIRRVEKTENSSGYPPIQSYTADEIYDFSLPGLLEIEPKDIKNINLPPKESTIATFKKILKIKINLALDKQVNAEDESFIRNLIFEKARLDIIRGDSLDITKTTFKESMSSNNQVEIKTAPPDLSNITTKPLQDNEEIKNHNSNNNILIYSAIGLLLVLVAAILFVFIILLKRQFKKFEQLQKPSPNGKETINNSQTIDHEKLTVFQPSLEQHKQNVVSMSLGNRAASQALLHELVAESDNLPEVVSVYETLGSKLFKSLYPTIDQNYLTQLELYAKEHSLNKESLLDHLSNFSNKLIQKCKTLEEVIRPFHFLENLDDSQILYLIKDEPTKIKAIVLSQLSSKRSAEIIKAIPLEEQANVAYELSYFEHLPIETFRDIANRLALKAQAVPSYSNVKIDGIQLLLNILDSMAINDATEFLNKLKQDSPDTYYKIRKIYFIFEDILRIPQHILKNIIREFSRTDITYALCQLSDELTLHILNALPSKLKAAVNEELQLIEKTAKTSEIERARLNIVNRLRQLIKSNRLSFSDLMSTT